MSTKSAIYKALRFSNDINAIRRGKVKQRIKRRIWGKISGRIMGRIR